MSNDKPSEMQFCPCTGRPVPSDEVAVGFGIAGAVYCVGMVGWGLKTGAITAATLAMMCGGAVTGVAIVGGLAYLISRDR